MALEQYLVVPTFYSTYSIDDTGGRLLWKKYPDGDLAGSAASPFAYDGAGRLQSIPGMISNVIYNARSQVLGAAYANNVSPPTPIMTRAAGSTSPERKCRAARGC